MQSSCLLHLIQDCRTGIAFAFMKKCNFKDMQSVYSNWQVPAKLYLFLFFPDNEGYIELLEV